MEFINMEFLDKFISDDAEFVLDILTWFKEIGSIDIVKKIIFDCNYSAICGAERSRARMLRSAEPTVSKVGFRYVKDNTPNQQIMIYNNHKNYRIYTDDIIKDIIKFLEKIDKNVIDLVIKEFIDEENKKYSRFGYSEYNKFAKFYQFNDKVKRKDANFLSINIDARIWDNFIKLSKNRGTKIEDLFKISLIRFLERRYEFSKKALNDHSEDIQLIPMKMPKMPMTLKAHV